jgi:NAD(P)H-hydrate epimerase
VYLATADEMRRLERAAADEAGISELVLMENAGAGAARIARSLLTTGRARVTVFAGPGNNGGDALVLARHLTGEGHRLTTFVVGGRPRGIAHQNLVAAARSGVQIIADGASGQFLEAAAGADLVVDGLLGTGLKGAPRGPIAEAIAAVRACGRPVLALDVPSGLQSDTGQRPGVAVRATVTATFGLAKPGLYLYPGAEAAGVVQIVDISLPGPVVEGWRPATRLLSPDLARGMLPSRPPWGHKGTFGHVIVLGGSEGMAGAPILAGLAALRAGAGLVTVVVPSPLDQAVVAAAPELMTIAVGSSGQWPSDSQGWFDRLLDRDPAALVLGPGMGLSAGSGDLVASVLRPCRIPVVVDADALNALSRLDAARRAACLGSQTVLTPHPGEMARLLDREVSSIQADRMTSAREAARNWETTVVLKGAGTVVAGEDGDAWLDPGGNPALATAGSGDVLAGVIGGLLAQGLPGPQAAALGVYLHRSAGDRVRARQGEAGALARDLLGELPAARKALSCSGDCPGTR